MIGLDTNVLVRYITHDDADQAAIANCLIESACTKRRPGRVCQIVLYELVWVLSRAYGYEKAQVVPVIDQILMSAELDVESEPLAREALAAWREATADYSDYLILLANRAAGCELTYSFDRRLARHPGGAVPE